MLKLTSNERPHPSVATRLTIDAARFMREQALVIRNTNTEQLSSLHYQGHHKSDWHSVGGIYSVPLWTIAISGITQAQQTSDDIAAKVNHYQSQQLKLVPRRPSIAEPYPLNAVFIDTLDPKITFAELAKQQAHLDSFLMAIKTFVRPFTAFGYGACGAYNFELLVASLNCNGAMYQLPYLDDLGRYSTGGRCADRLLHPGNIIYRVTFNAVEVTFFKKIINRQYDDIIFSGDLKPENDHVATAVRYMLCNHLAVEIISTKLVLFLNACGNTKQVICINQMEITQLWDNVLSTHTIDITKIIKNSRVPIYRFDYLGDKTYPIASNARAASWSDFMKLNRYATPIYQKFPHKQRSLDVLRSMFFYLTHITHTQPHSAESWQTAQTLLEKISHICQKDAFDTEAMGLLVIRYHRFKMTLNTSQQQVSTQQNRPTTATIRRPSQTLTWQILNGFLIVLGVAAVAFAFASLSLSSLSSTGLTVAAIGILSICLGGYGLFKQASSARICLDATQVNQNSHVQNP